MNRTRKRPRNTAVAAVTKPAVTASKPAALAASRCPLASPPHPTPKSQAVQNAERCRALSSENGELGAELEHVRALLKESDRRSAAAASISEELRLKRIEAGLLKEELGAVRQDCGRLVQLIRCVLCACECVCLRVCMCLPAVLVMARGQFMQGNRVGTSISSDHCCAVVVRAASPCELCGSHPWCT